MSEENLITLSGIQKTFVSSAENLTVLKSIDLEVGACSTVSITGRSGCGKSTLLSIIGGLDRASAGSLISVGLDIGPYTTDDELSAYRAASVGFIFQFHYLMKDFSALENVMLPAYMGGLSRKNASDKARALLDEVGLSSRLDHYPSQLSGGERQRIAVARALVTEPPLILADEPTGNLDESNTKSVADLLFGMVERHGKTLILVTHDQGLAASCMRSYLLSDGHLSLP